MSDVQAGLNEIKKRIVRLEEAGKYEMYISLKSVKHYLRIYEGLLDTLKRNRKEIRKLKNPEVKSEE